MWIDVFAEVQGVEYESISDGILVYVIPVQIHVVFADYNYVQGDVTMHTIYQEHELNIYTEVSKAQLQSVYLSLYALLLYAILVSINIRYVILLLY